MKSDPNDLMFINVQWTPSEKIPIPLGFEPGSTLMLAEHATCTRAKWLLGNLGTQKWVKCAYSKLWHIYAGTYVSYVYLKNQSMVTWVDDHYYRRNVSFMTIFMPLNSAGTYFHNAFYNHLPLFLISSSGLLGFITSKVIHRLMLSYNFTRWFFAKKNMKK